MGVGTSFSLWRFLHREMWQSRSLAPSQFPRERHNLIKLVNLKRINSLAHFFHCFPPGSELPTGDLQFSCAPSCVLCHGEQEGNGGDLHADWHSLWLMGYVCLIQGIRTSTCPQMQAMSCDFTFICLRAEVGKKMPVIGPTQNSHHFICRPENWVFRPK